MPVGLVRQLVIGPDFFTHFFEQICDQSDLNPMKKFTLGKFILCTAKLLYTSEVNVTWAKFLIPIFF